MNKHPLLKSAAKLLNGMQKTADKSECSISFSFNGEPEITVAEPYEALHKRLNKLGLNPLTQASKTCFINDTHTRYVAMRTRSLWVILNKDKEIIYKAGTLMSIVEHLEKSKLKEV